MIITGKNFSGLIDASNATEFDGCNFTQRIPREVDGKKVGVIIFTDNQPRTFTRCNLCNCEPPEGSTLIKCNTTIKSFDVITGYDEIEVDGEVLQMPIKEDIIHGKYVDGGYEY